MLSRLVCLFRRHDWHTEYNHETKRTAWECRRCGAYKVLPKPMGPYDIGAGGGIA